MKIKGRNTGMGAKTFVEVVSGDVKIYEGNFSRTGNHWDITVEGTGIIDIIDISNSQKHRCRRIKIRDGEYEATILEPPNAWWDECPICKKEI
ncbi:hypothetical protein J7K43_02295 [Candidatus Calescamantes bacterium]|nr:hypothetical protein [Candidatus Calescamantes bacterium]